MANRYRDLIELLRSPAPVGILETADIAERLGAEVNRSHGRMRFAWRWRPWVARRDDAWCSLPRFLGSIDDAMYLADDLAPGMAPLLLATALRDLPVPWLTGEADRYQYREFVARRLVAVVLDLHGSKASAA